MRAFSPSPDFTRPMGSDIPFVRVTTATNVCSDDAYTVSFPSGANQYIMALTLNFTDDEFDELTEKMAVARAQRIKQQEETYEALHAKFGGTWDNAVTTVDCGPCGGSGQVGNADDPESCNFCRGTGRVPLDFQ